MIIARKIKSFVEELKTYGYKEVYWHVLYMITKDDQYYLKQIQQKDIALRNKSHDEVVELIKAQYKDVLCKELNLDNPRTYNEKCQWLNAYDALPIKTRLADKYLVRSWIEEKMEGKESILVPLIGVFDSIDEVDFDLLPNQFCIKTNHGCAMNYVVRDKNALSKEEIAHIKSLVARWMQTPFWVQSFELHYRDIPRKILVEQYIEGLDGNLFDYKFLCFGGEPVYVNIIGDRDLKAHTAKEADCNMDWEKVNIMDISYDEYEQLPPKPVCFEQMKEICRVLSKDFPFVRVDLYEIDGKVLFGEMTFTPGALMEQWSNEQMHLTVGDMIQLPQNKYKLFDEK